MKLEDKMSVLLSIKLLREAITFWDNLLDQVGMGQSQMVESRKMVSERINDYMNNILNKQDEDDDNEFAHKKLSLEASEDAFTFYHRNNETLIHMENRIQDSLHDDYLDIVHKRMNDADDLFHVDACQWPTGKDDHLAHILQRMKHSKLDNMYSPENKGWAAMSTITMPANEVLDTVVKKTERQ